MNPAEKKPRLRCAIYTRKSSEEGLEQGFNSLHAQREACEAYVLSQAGEGWTALKDVYDDGGFSGGGMQRPALQRLLVDIAAGKLDIVVVYKVDRLTRSLTDFAKIVDIFDRHDVSFVSVTQAFNTTTSMGRLTLNVLLSFAQFEREVTGERIRDKIAASKKKGMWMGGIPPLGYDPPKDLQTRALVVNPGEADTVRLIFSRYLELGSVHVLERWLSAEGISSKAWTTAKGRQMGAKPFSRGALFHLLKSRIYRGEIVHRGQSHPGAHPAIVEAALFEEVQQLLASRAHHHRDRMSRVATMPLRGLIFDADGAPMSPTFTHRRQGKLYRYYVSTGLQQGRRITRDAITRVPAPAIERLVGKCLEQLLGEGMWPAVARVEIYPTTVQIILALGQLPTRGSPESELSRLSLRSGPTWRITAEVSNPTHLRVTIPVRMKLRGGRTWITDEAGEPLARGPADQALVAALKQAHVLLRLAQANIVARSDAAAPSHHFASTYQRRLAQLALLAPDLQLAILEGQQPLGMTLQSLIQLGIPSAWADQRRLFAQDQLAA